MATAVTMTPMAADNGPYQKRKRSRSRSPENSEQPPSTRRRSLSPPPPPSRIVEVPQVNDVDPVRRAEREKQLAARMAAMELEKMEKAKGNDKEKDAAFDAKAEFAKLTSTRSGGVYMPPARLRAMQEAASKDKASAEYQRISWDALRKSITGIVNRVNIANIKHIVPELFEENLIRGRGLFARSVMKAQSASLPFTPVFAALVAIINTKLPQVGELVLTRLISQFRRSFKRNDKIVCHSTTTFIGHLVNQGVAHEIIALQILVLLLERPTDDSIEIAVGFMREVGAFLAENSPKANATVFERFRAVLNEGTISHRVQYMIEVLMQVRKDKYKDNPIVPEGLDLVEEDDQITHQIQLEEELQVQEGLNIFKFDPNFLENEERYKGIKAEILGEGSDDEESGSEESEDEDEDEDEAVEDKAGIEDRTETNLINLRRVIYLTIMNALNYEEAVHKLLKVQVMEGQEIEMCNMIIECCSQERSYSTFYGLIGERFCKLNRVWNECFEQAFDNYYTTIHRYETNRLRNIARFFGHLIATDSVSWTVMECIKLTEDDTTSSSRIFIKIMMNEVTEAMGLKTVVERFKDPEVQAACRGMFPMDNPKDTRFAINYFTSVGLGAVTEQMREHLKNAPRIIMEQRRAMLEAESSSSDSDTDSDDDSSESDSDPSSSGSDTESDDSRHSGRRRRSPSPPRRDRGRGRDDSRLPPRRENGRVRDDSRTPPPYKNGQGRNDSLPPRRDRRPSPSPPPPSRYRNGDKGARDMGREQYRSRRDSPPPRRDSPPRRHASPPRRRDSLPHRRDSPPHRRDSPPRRRDYTPDRRDRARARTPLSPSPPPRPRYDSPRRNGDRDARRPKDDFEGRRRDDSRDRMRDAPRDRRRSVSRERYGRDSRR